MPWIRLCSWQSSERVESNRARQSSEISNDAIFAKQKNEGNDHCLGRGRSRARLITSRSLRLCPCLAHFLWPPTESEVLAATAKYQARESQTSIFDPDLRED